jgi:hypothetical protein
LFVSHGRLKVVVAAPSPNGILERASDHQSLLCATNPVTAGGVCFQSERLQEVTVWRALFEGLPWVRACSWLHQHSELLLCCLQHLTQSGSLMAAHELLGLAGSGSSRCASDTMWQMLSTERFTGT